MNGIFGDDARLLYRGLDEEKIAALKAQIKTAYEAVKGRPFMVRVTGLPYRFYNPDNNAELKEATADAEAKELADYIAEDEDLQTMDFEEIADGMSYIIQNAVAFHNQNLASGETETLMDYYLIRTQIGIEEEIEDGAETELPELERV